MKKRLLTLTCILAAASLTALPCLAEEETSGSLMDALAAQEYDESLMEETEITYDRSPFDLTDFLYADAGNYVTLGDLTGLTAEKPVYSVDEAAVDARMNEQISEYSQEVPVDRPVKNGDYVYGTLTYTVPASGETETDPEFVITLGEADYGDGFDEKLLEQNASVGDSLSFTVTYDEDDEYTYWPGETVDFQLEISKITELVNPELTDEFVKDSLGFDSLEEYRDSIRESIVAEYDEISMDDLRNSILNAAAAQCTFVEDMPEDMIEQSLSEYMDQFAFFLGDDPTMDDLCSLLGVTEDELREQASSEVAVNMMIHDYVAVNGVDADSDDYFSYIDTLGAQYGFGTGDDLEYSYGRDYLVNMFFYEKVTDALLETAEIVEVEGTDDSYEDEYISDEEESEGLDDEEAFVIYEDEEETE